MINLTVDSKANCFQLSGSNWTNLETIAQKCKLNKGTYVVKIRKGGFSFWAGERKLEPFVIVILRGGLFKNLATGIETSKTIETLNGFNDTITLKVEKTTTFHAFFLDRHNADNRGKVELSILQA